MLYATKTAITFSILAFAIVRILVNKDPCKDMNIENGLIGLIAGSYIEQGHQRMVKK